MNRFKNYFDLVKRHASDSRYHGVMRQLAEMAAVFLLRRIGPGFYLMAEMNKKEYDWRYKLGFLNGREYIKRVKEINNPAYLSVSFNKLVEKSLLNQFGLPTPKLYGHLHAVRGIDYQGGSCKGADDLVRLIKNNRLSKLCFKLVSGYGGSGFRAVEVLSENNSIQLKDSKSGRLFQPSEFCESLGLTQGIGYVVEQYFTQHEQMSRLNSSSVNTLRISVYQQPKQAPTCCGAFLRMGRSSEVVDNTMSGGIAAKVDLQTNKLLAGIEFSKRSVVHRVHPDSGQTIVGFSLPFFSEAKQLACKALQVLPEIYYAGVDVAIGPDGPVIIEFNAMADYSDFAISNAPSRYVLNDGAWRG